MQQTAKVSKRHSSQSRYRVVMSLEDVHADAGSNRTGTNGLNHDILDELEHSQEIVPISN